MAPPAVRYGPYDDGPDPLAPPFDVAEAVDALGDAVLDGASARDALAELLRRGAPGLRGLDALRARAREQARRLRRTHRLDATLEQVRELLDTALQAERAALFPDPDDAARFAEAQLDALPTQTAPAVQALAEYPWRSPQAAAAYAQISELLRQEVLDAQFAGMKQAMSGGDPAASQRVKDMLADLNAMLEADAAGRHTPADFDAFMDRYGDLFPDAPADLEELVDSLARRAAATARLLNSLTAEQRAELSALMEQAMADLDMASAMAQLGDHLRARRPDMDWTGRERMRGQQGLGVGEGTGALAELADLESLAESLGQDYPGAQLADVDEDAVARALGRSAVDDLDALRRIERELERQGYLMRADGRLELSAKAVRRLGRTALRRVFAALATARAGAHDITDAGAAGEMVGTHRAWEFGDEQPLDAVATLSRAVTRPEARRADGTLAVGVEDFAVRETEHRVTAAVVLLVDLSYSMILNDRWGPAKQTALALHTLIETQFPADALAIIGFSRHARHIAVTELAGLDGDLVQGTNLQHALMLAGRFLDRHPDAEPVVLVVSDGEPTAHLERDGSVYFDWPPSSTTLELTLAEVDRMTRRGAALNVFMLGEEPRLQDFVADVARRNGGRVFSPDPMRLGEFVVADFLATRRAARRR